MQLHRILTMRKPFLTLDHICYVSSDRKIIVLSIIQVLLYSVVYGDRQWLSMVSVEPVMDAIRIPITRNYGQTDGHLLGTKLPNKCPSVRTFHSFR